LGTDTPRMKHNSTFAESNKNCHPDDDDVEECLESECRERVRVGGGRPHEDDPAEVIRNRLLEFPTSGRVEGSVNVAVVVVAHAPEHKMRTRSQSYVPVSSL